MRLNRLSAQRHGKSNQRVTRRFPLLRDDRQLKRPVSGYIQFVADRWATGEFKNTTPAAAASQISRDWKALSESERKVSDSMIDVRLHSPPSFLTYPAEIQRRGASAEGAVPHRTSRTISIYCREKECGSREVVFLCDSRSLVKLCWCLWNTAGSLYFLRS